MQSAYAHRANHSSEMTLLLSLCRDHVHATTVDRCPLTALFDFFSTTFDTVHQSYAVHCTIQTIFNRQWIATTLLYFIIRVFINGCNRSDAVFVTAVAIFQRKSDEDVI